MCNCRDDQDRSIFIDEMEFYCFDSILRRLGCKKETIICNNSGFIANVYVSNTKTSFNDEDISINRKKLVDLSVTGDIKTNDITILNEYCRKISLTDYTFYVTVNVFYNKKWNKIYSCKKMNASQDIIIEPIYVKNRDNYM
tara:strand:+ start:3040 stop:3462 length:423 start_codon:yes stop_codon:yes gene_type:complete